MIDVIFHVHSSLFLNELVQSTKENVEGDLMVSMLHVLGLKDYTFGHQLNHWLISCEKELEGRPSQWK